MAKTPNKPPHSIHVRRKLLRAGVRVLVWLGLAVIYYAAFSFFFDTPVERGMRRSLTDLRTEYGRLSARYDTLRRVLANVEERDRRVFRTLYDSDPLSFDDGSRRAYLLDSLVGRSNNRLAQGLDERLGQLEEQMRGRQADLDVLQERVAARGTAMNAIPSIQPVIDPDLTLIGTSYGRRIQPFYRTLVLHTGMDFGVPEGTRVFATADGTVAPASPSLPHTGYTLTIDHEGGYQTAYHHLSAILTRPGSRVRRGDIVALTGDTGLSLAPHLHYEVRLNGEAVDPVHYFFYELGPEAYERARRQAAVGMQSLD